MWRRATRHGVPLSYRRSLCSRARARPIWQGMTPCNCHQHGGNVSGDDASGQTLVMKQFETSANPEQRAQPVHVPDGSNVRRIGGELFIVEEAAHEKAEHTGSSNTSRDNGEQPEQCGVVCHELASIFGAFVASVIDNPTAGPCTTSFFSLLLRPNFTLTSTFYLDYL